ncbi:MAG: DUF3048 C-terminal domain-containing protein [Anaerolineales bacterium]|jgi:hypothetical protein|nr:DUF3048 C-terminal domain-containing protein [Anaerolineales bacterium]
MKGSRQLPPPVYYILIAGIIAASCADNITAPSPTAQLPSITSTPATPPPTSSPTPQAFSTPAHYGPDNENFPPHINPLNGRAVEDPSLFDTPAVAISISHFPAAARPQAGLSFAPWVFEFYITEGATRFLAIFHGEFPQPEQPITGDCPARSEPFVQTINILGNRIWLDQNKNGTQEDYEKGVGGVCVNLLDASGSLLQQTASDSNGYYGFNVQPGEYIVEFKIPAWLKFTRKNIGDEDRDSDADPDSGRAGADLKSTLLYLDAGLVPSEETRPPSSDSQLPAAEVGPVRSGRLLYIDIHNMFINSCFIYASASPEILPMLPQCYLVPHDEASGGAMLPIEKMKSLAEENRESRSGEFNYASNVFSETPPPGGLPANKVNSYIARLNQAAWMYDPLSASYWRYVDDTTPENAGNLHAEIDRLTGRQLQFENIVVLFVEQEVFEYRHVPIPTLIDWGLELGGGGFGVLFRDGMKYDIRWSARAREYEKETGLARPVYFTDAGGNPAPLKPGQTWLFVATPYSYVTNQGDGSWVIRYVAPEGAK